MNKNRIIMEMATMVSAHLESNKKEEGEGFWIGESWWLTPETCRELATAIEETYMEVYGYIPNYDTETINYLKTK